MKFVKITLALVFITGLIIVGLASRRPDTFHIERSMTTTAPAQAIYPWLVDLSRFQEWSPYRKLDPNMKVTISANPAGIGASSAWEGNGNSGSGLMTIVGATQDQRVDVKLEMYEPMAATNQVAWTIADQGDTRLVVWSMDGDFPLISRIIDVFLNIDQMVGKDFEGGLAKLKTLDESGQ